MTFDKLLEQARAQASIQFDQLMTVIAEHYDYTPSAFGNGIAPNRIENQAGQNEGSCKLFAFAKLHQLDQNQTLNLFGTFYHEEVMTDPDGSSHANIRAFMRDGWEGVQFDREPLSRKPV